MKKTMTRNIVIMAIVTVIMAVVLSLYIKNTGTVPAADNAASLADGTYTASEQGCLSEVAVTVTVTATPAKDYVTDGSFENAENDKKEASALKAEYEAKLKDAHKEAEQILSDARKTAMHNETKIIDEAKAEAARIIERANVEAELEKQKVADEVKQQIVTVAAVMASKLVARSIDEKDSNALIEETLNEMGEKTWLS